MPNIPVPIRAGGGQTPEKQYLETRTPSIEEILARIVTLESKDTSDYPGYRRRTHNAALEGLRKGAKDVYGDPPMIRRMREDGLLEALYAAQNEGMEAEEMADLLYDNAIYERSWLPSDKEELSEKAAMAAENLQRAEGVSGSRMGSEAMATLIESLSPLLNIKDVSLGDMSQSSNPALKQEWDNYNEKMKRYLRGEGPDFFDAWAPERPTRREAIEAVEDSIQQEADNFTPNKIIHAITEAIINRMNQKEKR